MKLFIIRFLQIVSIFYFLCHVWFYWGFQWVGWYGQSASSSGQCGANLNEEPSAEDLRLTHQCVVRGLAAQIVVPAIVEIVFLLSLNRFAKQTNIKKL